MTNLSIKNSILGLASLVLLSSVSLRANTVTVEELGVGANETAWIDSSGLGTNLHVYASVVKLKVDGIATDGFCIDPWHWSSGGVLTYTEESLALAPKSANNSTPSAMGASAALQIEQLWRQYYSPSISNIMAAALQVKIWEIVDAAVTNGTFTLDSVDGADSAAVYAALTAMDNFLLTNPGAPAANLVAVTGSGQDYVIAVPEVTSTVALLGLAVAGLGFVRRKNRLG